MKEASLFFVTCSIAAVGFVIAYNHDFNHPIEQTKTFKVECKSFDFDGEVYRDGKKFYELIGGKEIWIPLGDCLLREVE
ncbi:TMhelix containing protein [Vibrio phage 1.197.A._10N.286.54.F2]|nr:TMhelix containing protein [Vibrio phage 1.197.A._10N.286.54.F2]